MFINSSANIPKEGADYSFAGKDYINALDVLKLYKATHRHGRFCCGYVLVTNFVFTALLKDFICLCTAK